MFIHHSDSFVSRIMSSSQASAGPWNKKMKNFTDQNYLHSKPDFKNGGTAGINQGFSGRRRPRHPGLLRPSFPVLNSSFTSYFSSTAVLVGELPFGIQRRSFRTETRNLEIQDSEDVDVLRRSSIDDSPWQRNRHLHWVCSQFFLAISLAFACDSKFDTFSTLTVDCIDL